MSGAYPTITNDAQLKYIFYVPSGGSDALFLVNGVNGITLTHSSGVITVDGGGTPFASGDVYEVGINAPKIETDYSLSIEKTIEQSPLWSRYTDSEVLVSASDIGTTDDTWVDQGSEIDCRGYNKIGVWVVFTVNDSTGNQLQILPKFESAGSDEFIMETSSDYQKTIGNSSTKIYYEFQVDNIIPFIQIQTKATDVDTGGGTEGTVTINITKGY